MKKSRLTHRVRSIAGGAVAVAIFFSAVAFSPGTAVCETAKKVKLRENSYYYSAFNRRDPFRSLVSGRFVRNEKMELVSLSAVELVGIIRGDLDRFALLEDEKGFSYIMRVGDRVRNGTVVSIGDQSMVARVTNFGQTTKFTLHLVQRQEGVKR
jgi:hypothetical protein